MSITLKNKDIIKLMYEGKEIKRAYYNNKVVWEEKHRVRFYDNVGNLLKTQYVEHGKAADDFIAPVTSDTFYTYKFTGWDKPITNITEDTDIYATATKQTAYLFKNEKGLNPDYYSNANTICTAYDNTSSMAYTSIAKGNINDTRIYCVHTGSTSSSNTLFRSIRYVGFPTLNMETINNQGYTKLKVSGTYIFTSGNVYREANLRVVFVCLQTTTKVTTKTADGIEGDYKHQVRINKNVSSLSSVTASSGAFNGEITLPTTGDYYLIVGELSKAFSGATSITINNIWLE